jgi:hypothetical protein
LDCASSEATTFSWVAAWCRPRSCQDSSRQGRSIGGTVVAANRKPISRRGAENAEKQRIVSSLRPCVSARNLGLCEFRGYYFFLGGGVLSSTVLP